MSIEGQKLREMFWQNDIENNGGRLYYAYNEVYDIILNRNGKNEAIISNKMENILRHAANTTDFYAYLKNNISYNIKDFPVINKQTIIENRKAMFSKEYIGAELHEMHTSGSTGIPFTIQQDKDKRTRVIAEIKAFNEIANYPSHEKMLYILGGRRSQNPYSLEQQKRENIWRIPVAVNDDETMQRLVDFLINEKPIAIHASASNFPPLIEFIKRKQISSDKFNIRSIITGGEMVPQRLRIDLETVFGDKCKVYVKYSNEEMGIFGIDTGIDTPYILNVADYYFEILKMDSNEPCLLGELGRIVVTDYHNFALPMIRYDTGDLGVLEQKDGKWPVISNLSGKRRDLIYNTSGVSISGLTFTNILKMVNNVAMWQLIQTEERAYIYKIVPVKGTNPSNKDILLSDLYCLLGSDANIKVEIVNDIPATNSQKRRYTVNLWKPQ